MKQDKDIPNEHDIDFHEWLDRKLEQVRLEEREACAKVCDDIGDSDNGYGCAAAIRARSTK